ncbi:MAG: hypothetical protein NVS3B10_22050 [Polyangiales bacterium]
MATPQKHGVNGAMAEQKESSVLFSLKELMSLEENRIKEEDEAKKRRAEDELRAREDSERRAREEEELRLRSEEERRRQDELRRKMEEAQVEAAKAAEIEKRKLEEQHRLAMVAQAQQQAHEKEIHVIQSQKRKGIHPGILGGIGLAVLGLLFAVIYFTAIQPKSQAKEAIKKAETYAASADDNDWDRADQQLAIAKDKDPSNPEITQIESKVKDKRDKLAAVVKAKEAEREALLQKLQMDLKGANDDLANAHTDAEKNAAQAKIDAAKKNMGSVQQAPKAGGGTKPPCVCPPGVPLCNC